MVYTEYEITYEQFDTPGIKKMPEDLYDHYQQLLLKIKHNPKETVSELIKLLKRYHNHPKLLNLLATGYSLLGDMENARDTAYRNYKKNPYYLFAKINYAQLCLLNNDLDMIPKIFKNKFDLKALYPNRDKFHISEYINFAAICGEYFYRIGNIKTALIFYEGMKKINPGHEKTKLLKSLVKPGFKQKVSKLIDQHVLDHIKSRDLK